LQDRKEIKTVYAQRCAETRFSNLKVKSDPVQWLRIICLYAQSYFLTHPSMHRPLIRLLHCTDAGRIICDVRIKKNQHANADKRIREQS
jgi:hypothetical protein